jgi:metal-responsive CopG/Arc/MetJ family transcriptional regulator
MSAACKTGGPNDSRICKTPGSLSYMPDTVSLTIRVEPDLLDRLDQDATRRKITRSDALRRILRSALVPTIDAPPEDGRVAIEARVQRTSADRLDEIARTRPGWSRSDALRHLLALGLAAYDSHGKRAALSAARTAATPAPDPDTPRQVRTHPKSEAGRRRDR